MEKEQQRVAKEQMVALVQAGQTFQQASTMAGVQISRSAAYRHLAESPSPRRNGLARWQTWIPHQSAPYCAALAGVAVSDHFTGCQQPGAKRTPRAVGSADQHRSSKRCSGSTWMEQRCQPCGKKIRQKRKRTLSREPEGCYCWRLPMKRVCSLISRQQSPRVSRQRLVPCSPVLRIACANWCSRCSSCRLRGVRRTHDLRSYTGNVLAVMTGRHRAYGYCHTERFLSQLAKANGAEALTSALGSWTAHLWEEGLQNTGTPPCFYIDGHRKPVYADCLIPRGLIGRSGKILGGRALALLHDEQGHPLLATTARGDQHLTVGLPQVLERYDQAGGKTAHARIIVDREGMAAPFLKDLAEAGHTVVTLLKTNQYEGLASFTNLGEFVPLTHDRSGQVVREVAPACFALALPDHKDQILPLHVALIRDHRRQVPDTPPEEDANDEPVLPPWWRENWQAEPTKAEPTTAKLIPIVTTAPHIDAVELAQTYIRRWPLQENVIRDYLSPLGLDTNHGYAKAPVPNSEVSKKRAVLQKRLSDIQKWAPAARKRSNNASARHRRLWKETKAKGEERYRALDEQLQMLQAQGVTPGQWKTERNRLQAEAEREMQELWERVSRVLETCNKEFAKWERYCREQGDLLRALEDLEVQERTMYELDNRKDHIMTICKLALANLAMWTRDQYFPALYAHATWARLAPFFQLPGTVTSSQQAVTVQLHPFNDRQYNRDLSLLCQCVNEKQPHLPDGRLLLFRVQETARPILHQQHQLNA